MIEQTGLCKQGEKLRAEFRACAPRWDYKHNNVVFLPEIRAYYQHKARCPECRRAMWIIHRARVEAK